jgi:hypothetical protein
MSSTGTTTAQEPPLKSPGVASRLELVAKFGALFLGLVYALGFLIVAIHHAQFSIPQFDPLKTKIFSTGLFFLLMVGAPAMFVFRTLGLVGLKAQTGFGISCDPKNQDSLRVALVVGSFFPAYGLGRYLAGTFFGTSYDFKRWGFTGFLVCAGTFILSGVFMKKRFDKWPGTFVLLAALQTIGTFIFALRFDDRRMFGAGLWFFGVGLLSLYVLHVIKKPDEWRSIEWERQLPIIAVVLLLYSSLIYRNISSYFGGGVPVPVTMYFSSAKVPIASSDSAELQLIEETSDGYYVLKSGDEKHAFFLRRDLVSAIHFGVPEPKPR